MIAKSEELRSFIDSLNEDENFMKDHKAKLEKLSVDLEASRWVTLKNGETKQYKVTEIIPVMYTDLKEINAAVEPLKDANKVHSIFKKYKVYYLLGLALTPASIVWFWENFLLPILREFNLHP